MSYFLCLLILMSGAVKKKKIVKKSIKVVKYKGVTPPSPTLPKMLPKPGKNCLLVWPGFHYRTKLNNSRLFFLFTSPIKLTSKKIQIKRKRILRLTIPNCKAWEKNAWRALITKYFKTPISKVSFYKDSKIKGLIIDIQYKNKITTHQLSYTNFAGYYLLLFDYPPHKK
jgi:hypothetical protein